MILDTLNHWSRYEAHSPRFQQAFNFLQEMGDDLKAGRHPINGDDTFAIIQKYTTKRPVEWHFEAHRTFIDIHYIHSGSEIIYWKPLPVSPQLIMPYDADEDALIFEDGIGGCPISLNVGQFCIFFPLDAHMPCCASNETGDVIKSVVKVRIS